MSYMNNVSFFKTSQCKFEEHGNRKCSLFPFFWSLFIQDRPNVKKIQNHQRESKRSHLKIATYLKIALTRNKEQKTIKATSSIHFRDRHFLRSPQTNACVSKIPVAKRLCRSNPLPSHERAREGVTNTDIKTDFESNLMFFSTPPPNPPDFLTLP